MKIDMNLVSNVFRIAPLIVRVVQFIDDVFDGEPGVTKQEKAVSMLLGLLGDAGKEFGSDPQVLAAIKAAMDAIVAVEKAIAAAKAAKKASAPVATPLIAVEMTPFYPSYLQP